MALEQAYPAFNMGPRADLADGYLNLTINGTTLTPDPTNTSPGFSIARSTNGVYTVTHPKCKYCQPIVVFKPVNAAGGRAVRVLAGADPTVGTFTVELSTDGTANGAAADPAAAANQMHIHCKLGF